MQLPSQIILLTSLLAAIPAVVTSPTYQSSPQPIIAKILSYDSTKCPSKHGAVHFHKIVQDKCTKLPEFLSYKIWQPVPDNEKTKQQCTFSVYPDADGCSGESHDAVELPQKKEEADCQDFIVSSFERDQGPSYVRFSCENLPIFPSDSVA